MIIRVILIAVILYLVLTGLRHINKQPPEVRKKLLWKYGIYGIALLMLLLAATGRMHWIGAALAGLFALIKAMGPRVLTLLPILTRLRGSSFTNPVLTTRFLKVSFNLKTQELSGEILQGTHQGKNLSELTLEELQQLVVTYQQQDPESARLLTAYLYRYHGGTRQQEQKASATAPGDMNRHEALQILGLAEQATESDIVQAHRRLIQKLHPDRGGSDYLAAKINQAKDFLLKT